MPDGIYGLSVNKILESGVAVGADHQHFRSFFLYDTNNFPASPDITQAGYGPVIFFFQALLIGIQPFLVVAGFEVVTLFSQHAGRSAFHNMDQHILAVAATLTNGKSQQLFIMSAEIKCNGNLFEFGNLQFNDGGTFSVHGDFRFWWLPGPGMKEYI